MTHSNINLYFTDGRYYALNPIEINEYLVNLHKKFNKIKHLLIHV